MTEALYLSTIRATELLEAIQMLQVRLNMRHDGKLFQGTNYQTLITIATCTAYVLGKCEKLPNEPAYQLTKFNYHSNLTSCVFGGKETSKAAVKAVELRPHLLLFLP